MRVRIWIKTKKYKEIQTLQNNPRRFAKAQKRNQKNIYLKSRKELAIDREEISGSSLKTALFYSSFQTMASNGQELLLSFLDEQGNRSEIDISTISSQILNMMIGHPRKMTYLSLYITSLGTNGAKLPLKCPEEQNLKLKIDSMLILNRGWRIHTKKLLVILIITL